MKKKKSHAFGKEIYLLGQDSDGKYVWLEAPTWDCGWYWGFGYVERYTNNRNPEKAKDIQSHTHINSEFKNNGVINVNLGLEVTTYTKSEGLELNKLFTEFYRLKELAEKLQHADKNTITLVGLLGGNLGNIQTDFDIVSEIKNINENLIPNITKRILEILS